MQELIVEAKKENLNKVQQFVLDFMTKQGFEEEDKMKVDVVIEEIFVNICSYAYEGQVGQCIIQQIVDNNNINITFIDSGVPYNPLDKKDPDISLDVEDRPIGGLGIFMTKKMMDNVSYEYKNNQNMLTITKQNSKRK